MAATTTSNFSNFLIRVYSREKFAPFERSLTPFLNSLEDAADEPAVGTGRRFGIRTADAHAVSPAAEGSVFPDLSQPSVLQAEVTPVSVVAAFGLSEQAIVRGVSDGTLNQSILNDHVVMTIRNLLSAVNRYTVAGHNTGRMARVQTTTVASTTFVADLPEGAFQLRPGMTIDFYDLDTGGAKQGATETISFVNYTTRTVTIGNARSLTAGWGIYKALTASVSGYGVAPQGLRGIADDGTLQTTIFGLSRSTNPALSASVLTASASSPQSFSELLVRKALRQIELQADVEGTEIWCNLGIIDEYLKVTIPDRRYNVTGGEVPDYKIGYKPESLGFQYGGKVLPFRVDKDYPAREFVVITKPYFRRHITKKASWVGDGTAEAGSGSAILLQAPSTTTYSFNKIAAQMWDGTISHRQPKLNTRVTNVADETLAGDA
jgi:hypothetical protein